MVVRVLANIEFEPEELITEVSNDYECSIAEVSMDNIMEYINDHITYMKGENTSVIKEVGDGPAIDGFDDRDYWKVSDVLDRMQDDAEE